MKRTRDNLTKDDTSQSSSADCKIQFSAFRQTPYTSSAGSDVTCQICGDKATGRHYGAVSCDGCKGFFRRSIRKRQNYQCRHQKSCNVDKDKRNQCRYCRFQKCLQIGMKQEAVQSERDRISTKSIPSSSQSTTLGSSNANPENNAMLSVIMNAELVFQHAPPASPIDVNIEAQEAGVEELLTSMKEQVLLLVQWAKRIPRFMQLAVEDQICLLKAHASEHLLLGATRRSRNQDYLLLGNNYIVSRQSPENSFALIAGRVLDQLIVAFRSINIDDTEYACLKAIVFFDPYADGLQARHSVFQMRQEVILALYTYIRGKFYGSQVAQQVGAIADGCNSQSRAPSPLPGPYAPIEFPSSGIMQEFAMVKRFGELLLLVPSVRSIAEDMVDHIKFYKLFGAAKVDNVLHELLLGDTASDDNMQGPVMEVPPPGRRSYPSSRANTPVLVANGPIAPNASELYGQQALAQANFTNNAFVTPPEPGNFESQAVASSVPPPQFGGMDQCIPPQLRILSPQPSSSNRQQLSQSPGLSTLAAAAFVASQSMNSQIPESAIPSTAYIGAPMDQYPTISSRNPSPAILALAFSTRTPTSANMRGSIQSQQSIVNEMEPVTLKPEQLE